jgi:ribonuclease HII
LAFLPRELDFPERQVCGIDEAGRGPLAGPLSLALVHFPPTLLLEALQGKVLKGLTDSKKLSEKKRESLYEEILSLDLVFAHVFLSPSWIDDLGLSRCIRIGMEKLVQKSKLEQPFLLIDGNYKFPNLLGEREFPPYESIIKGDSKILSISAASIVAKVRRDRYMIRRDSLYPQYQFKVHKGYGTELHRNILQEFGFCPLHRKTFIKNLKLGNSLAK